MTDNVKKKGSSVVMKNNCVYVRKVGQLSSTKGMIELNTNRLKYIITNAEEIFSA
ncbi:hypothetical protein N9R04_03395 [Staphylococcus sp. SQ8-PEA]|uniref:Uncharacterized protein n=1 Tax=Staphylococcus marylandisciuri TaxID=2981529 RepID=A0ABT2QP74_9STAP|nr:hypothetical protein [Staphylococcus marylandisciuri]MCU5745767.1 hypothetical protein [Staphylococcus marylandisciuri]